MKQNDLFHILLAPHISEKSARGTERNREYVFKVVAYASKLEIKQAVELMFKTKVAAVRTLNVLGKKKRTARTVGKRKDWKKAYVTLQAGSEISLGESA